MGHCAEHHGWDQFLEIWACENLEGPAIAHLPPREGWAVRRLQPLWALRTALSSAGCALTLLCTSLPGQGLGCPASGLSACAPLQGWDCTLIPEEEKAKHQVQAGA